MRLPTNAELNDETIPHVHLTSDMLWNPSKYNDVVDDVPTAPFTPFGHNNNTEELNYDVHAGQKLQASGCIVVR
jgi:hypothetical protein